MKLQEFSQWVFTIDILTMWYILKKVLQTLNVGCLKTICLISFKLTAFFADINKSLHINFLSNWLSFKVTENFMKLAK